MERRKFLQSTLLAGAGLAFSRRNALAVSAADAQVEVLLEEPLGTIAPEIYGQFTEQLGGTIYDGVWVGEGSKIANQRGIRSALIEKLRAIQMPVCRWPGGCFADSYDWQDGIGPRAKRPTRTNFWEGAAFQQLHGKGVQLYEDNAFGTDDFVRFCKLTGAQPYLAANLRSLPALDFDHWIEYCNSPTGSTTLARQRAANGSSNPYNVRYWGVGNEAWGCGGNFSPEDYANEFRRFTAWTPHYGMDLQFIGSGPNDDDVSWTRRFFDALFTANRYYDRKTIWGWSVHHYATDLSRGKPHTWDSEKGDAIQFDSVDWYELLKQADLMEPILHDHWAALAEYDPEHRIKLVVDEYGPWYRPGTEQDPTQTLGQQITVRDALATALTLDTFNRNPEKVGMAACAQLVNCLNSLFLAHEDNFITTPNYNVFAMYMPHMGAQAVRAECFAPEVHYPRDGKPASFWGLKGSASIKDKTLTVTLVNPNLSAAHDTEIVLRGGTPASAKGSVITASDVHAHNTFTQPDAVKTAALQVAMDGSRLRCTLPPGSVAALQVQLG